MSLKPSAMSRLSVILALFLGLATPAVAEGPVPLAPVAGEPVPVPSVEIRDLEGRSFDLASALGSGEVVVLNFWASWCAPCKREMPTLAALQAAFADRPLRVVALAMDRAEPEALLAFMQEAGADGLTVWHDPAMATARPLGIQGLPVTLVVDGEGNEVFRHAGYADWSAPEIVTFLEGLLEDAS